MKAYSIPTLRCACCGFVMLHRAPQSEYHQRLVCETQRIVVECTNPNCEQSGRLAYCPVTLHELFER